MAVVAATWPVSKRDAFVALPGLADKMADMKLKGPAGDALTAMSEACGPQFVCTQLHKKAAGHKNPKVSNMSLCCTHGACIGSYLALAFASRQNSLVR